MRDDMQSILLEQKHYSSPLESLGTQRKKTVAFISFQDSFEPLPMVWEGSVEVGFTKTTTNIY